MKKKEYMGKIEFPHVMSMKSVNGYLHITTNFE